MKVIQPSKSRHRSNAFLVRKHSEIIRGEPRIVYKYKDLNANTYPNKYPIPYITYMITRIKDKKFYSKFDHLDFGKFQWLKNLLNGLLS